MSVPLNLEDKNCIIALQVTKANEIEVAPVMLHNLKVARSILSKYLEIFCDGSKLDPVAKVSVKNLDNIELKSFLNLLTIKEVFNRKPLILHLNKSNFK